jgi:hypothetical protein
VYFHAESEAHVLLDAARAMTELYAHGGSRRPAAETFFGGYSQGGHAAFAVADRHRRYAPEVDVDRRDGLRRHHRRAGAARDGRVLRAVRAARVPVGLRRRAIDPAQVLAARFVPTLEQDAGAFCVDRAQQVYPYDGAGTFTAAFHRALQTGDPASVAPEFALALAMNETGLSGHGLPALVVQGGQDVIVRDATQERFVAALCAAGSPVTYLNFPNARHRDTRPAGFDASLAWMWSLVDDAPPPSTCAD